MPVLAKTTLQSKQHRVTNPQCSPTGSCPAIPESSSYRLTTECPPVPNVSVDHDKQLKKNDRTVIGVTHASVPRNVSPNVKLPDYPTKKQRLNEFGSSTSPPTVKNPQNYPPNLLKRPIDDFWLQVYEQINKFGGPVDLFIDVLEGLTTNPVEIRQYAESFYSSLKSLTEGKDLEDLVGLNSFMNVLRLMSSGSLSKPQKLAVEIKASYHRLTNVINKIKGLDDALEGADDGYGEIQESIVEELTRAIFPFFVTVIDENTYRLWSEITRQATIILLAFEKYLEMFKPYTIDQLKENIPGLTQVLDILERTSYSKIESVEAFVKLVESRIEYIGELDNDIDKLTHAIAQYHERHAEEGTDDGQIIEILNEDDGPISLIQKILTGVMTGPSEIGSTATVVHKLLIARVSDLTKEPLDSIQQRIPGFKVLFILLEGIINGSYRTASEIGEAALDSKNEIIAISNQRYDIEAAFGDFEAREEVEWLRQKIGSKLVEKNGTIDFLINVLNGIYMYGQGDPDDQEISQDAIRISEDLTNAISGWTNEDLESLKEKMQGLTELYEALEVLIDGSHVDDQLFAIREFVDKVNHLVDPNRTQPLIDALNSAWNRALAMTMRAEINTLIHSPGNAFELVDTILRGAVDIADVKEEARNIYDDLESIGRNHLPSPKVPDLVALLNFFEKLSLDGGFSSLYELASNFALLLYRIENVNPQGTGQSSLKFYVLRVGIQDKVMENDGVYAFFSSVLTEEVTATADLVAEAKRVRKELTATIFSLTYEPLETVRTEVGGLGPLLDVLNSVSIKSDVNGTDIANMLYNIMPTLRPIISQLQRLQKLVVEYLDAHGTRGTRAASTKTSSHSHRTVKEASTRNPNSNKISQPDKKTPIESAVFDSEDSARPWGASSYFSTVKEALNRDGGAIGLFNDVVGDESENMPVTRERAAKVRESLLKEIESTTGQAVGEVITRERGLGDAVKLLEDISSGRLSSRSSIIAQIDVIGNKLRELGLRRSIL